MSGEFPNKATQFTSTNQPNPERKRVPKLKSRLRHLLSENYNDISNAIIKECKNGSIKHIEFLRDWLYGKVKDEVDHTLRVDKTILEVIADQLTNKNEVQKTNE
jgi:hypothetical protein